MSGHHVTMRLPVPEARPVTRQTPRTRFGSKQTHVLVDDELVERLRELSHRTRVSQAQYLREAISDVLEKHLGRTHPWPQIHLRPSLDDALPQVLHLEADGEALPMNQPIEEMGARLRAAQAVVDEQAEDGGLWFIAETAPEALLQNELRRLHAAVEGESIPLTVGEASKRANEWRTEHDAEVRALAIEQCLELVSRCPDMGDVHADDLRTLAGLAPCGGSRCFRGSNGEWIHSSKSYSTCRHALTSRGSTR